MTASLDDILNSRRTGKPVVMGVLNVTPDSFCDGGEFLAPSDAVEQARRMVTEGAGIIDVGAESTRPGSRRIPADEQIDRLREILPAVVAAGAVVSIDTTSAEVAHFALREGAGIVNDISAGRDDGEMLALVARRKVPVVLMHVQGTPATMQQDPRYDDVISEVRDFLWTRLDAAAAAGVARGQCIVDPGIGFGKNLQHNLALLAGIGQLLVLGCPVLVGPSRKRFIGELTGQSRPADRLAGTLAAVLAAWRAGATIFRVHDVGETVSALTVTGAIEKGSSAKNPDPG